MNKLKQDPADRLVALTLEEEQLAQIDKLIESHAASSHRLTREEMLHLLVEKGCAQVAQGESLLPFLGSSSSSGR